MAVNTDVATNENTISLTRKLRRSGNSTVLTIPTEILETADLEADDEIEFALDNEGRIVLSKTEDA